MRYPLLILVLLLVACGGQDGRSNTADNEDIKGLYDIDDEGENLKEEEVLAAIQRLDAGRNPDDAEQSKVFDEAVIELTMMGSAVEAYLIEALVGNDDWAVRYGVIHVIDAVGGKESVDALIGALADEHPLVALKAMYSLRGLTGHRVVPVAGEPPLEDLPAVPERAPDDLRPDAELEIWSEWHYQHAQQLHQHWQRWWEAHRLATKIE